MYHSITFGTKNTWDDWHLIPLSRPVFNPPEQKRTLVEVPGRDGALDFSTAITGYPTFQNRTGSFEFIVDWNFKPWTVIYSEVTSYLQGKTLEAVLEDEPDWKYVGTFNVNKWESKNDGTGSRITIEYNVYPYKKPRFEIDDPNYLWDPFDLVNGVSWYEATQNIVLPDRQVIKTWYVIDFGNLYLKPFYPTVVLNSLEANRLFIILYRNSDLDKGITVDKIGAATTKTMTTPFLSDKYDHMWLGVTNKSEDGVSGKATFSLKFSPERL